MNPKTQINMILTYLHIATLAIGFTTAIYVTYEKNRR